MGKCAQLLIIARDIAKCCRTKYTNLAFCRFAGTIMRRVSRSRRSQRSGLAKPINDGSYSWFDRHDLVGNFLMEPHGIVRLEYVLFKKPSRTYVLRERPRKKCKQIFINVRTTL